MMKAKTEDVEGGAEDNKTAMGTRMNFRIKCLVAAVLALVVTGLSGCDMFGFRDWSWHQKLTVTVETPTGVKTGSAVTAARMEDPPKWWGAGDAAGAMNDSLRGEAVVIDLGPAAPGPRYLFALLKGYSVWTAYAAFFPDMTGKPMPEDARHALYDQLETFRATKDLPRDLYPLLVTFADITDPASVSRVDPDDLAASFGLGYVLTSITLAITDEPVTKGRVEAVLAWLEEVGRRRPTLIPEPPRLRKDASDPDIQYLTPGPFSTELYK